MEIGELEVSRANFFVEEESFQAVVDLESSEIDDCNHATTSVVCGLILALPGTRDDQSHAGNTRLPRDPLANNSLQLPAVGR